MIRLLLSLLILASTGISAQDRSASIDKDWPQWRGPRGDGTWHAPQIAEDWPEGGLKELWSKPVGGGYAGVTVAIGKVLVLDRQTRPLDPKTSKPNPKNEFERLLCFDAKSGVCTCEKAI